MKNGVSLYVLNGIQEAGGSIPPSSTNIIKDLAFLLGPFFVGH